MCLLFVTVCSFLQHIELFLTLTHTQTQTHSTTTRWLYTGDIFSCSFFLSFLPPQILCAIIYEKNPGMICKWTECNNTEENETASSCSVSLSLPLCVVASQPASGFVFRFCNVTLPRRVMGSLPFSPSLSFTYTQNRGSREVTEQSKNG